MLLLQLFPQLLIPRAAILLLMSAIFICGLTPPATASDSVEHVRLTGGQFFGGGFVEIWRRGAGAVAGVGAAVGVGWRAVCDRDRLTWTQREGDVHTVHILQLGT